MKKNWAPGDEISLTRYTETYSEKYFFFQKSSNIFLVKKLEFWYKFCTTNIVLQKFDQLKWYIFAKMEN